MAQTNIPSFTLNTGAKIPAIGFGTWKAAPGEAKQAVKCAFEAGYRHFDCAPLYFNEAEIGEAFLESKVPREEYFVTTKLWASQHRNVEAALDRSLADLHLTYVDLYLMHWPVSLDPTTGAELGKEDRTRHDPDWDFSRTWSEMERLLGTGKVKAIGVANFSTVNLDKLLQGKDYVVVPAVNQTEIQPLLPQTKLNAYCQARGIHQTAFGPLGGSGSTLHTDPVVVGIAEKNGATPAQVLLSWGVAKGWSVVPKSVNPGRIRSNLRLVKLDVEEVQRLDALHEKGGKRFNRPNWGTVIFHDDEGLDIA